MNKKCVLYSLLVLLVVSSCNEAKVLQELSDDFSTHNPIWKTKQISDSSRFLLVKDPIDYNNSCVQFALFPNDINAGRKRNEYVLKTKDSINNLVNYSFKFLLPDSFFKEREKEDWIMIHQWHDDPPKGVKWKDYKDKTQPPVSLYIKVTPNNPPLLKYTYGLHSKYIEEKEFYTYKRNLRPNTWYHFSNTVKWSLDSLVGFSSPKVNDEYLASINGKLSKEIRGRNMFNTMPNYYKMGIYGNKEMNDSIYILFDDFEYELREY